MEYLYNEKDKPDVNIAKALFTIADKIERYTETIKLLNSNMPNYQETVKKSLDSMLNIQNVMSNIQGNSYKNMEDILKKEAKET